MNKLCELFGHKVSQMALLICEIKANPLNIGKPNFMKCERKGCGWTLDLNNADAITAYEQNKPKFFKTLWNMIKSCRTKKLFDATGG